jgi:hypothetical protein
MLDDEMPKVFGLEDLDLNKRIYMFEGPIDAMFIENGLASAGGKIESNIQNLGFDKSNVTIIYDNEPRSVHTVEKMNKAIATGHQICIWPDTIKQNDVNNMILAGMTSDAITNVINKNTYHGLSATLQMATWNKV